MERSTEIRSQKIALCCTWAFVALTVIGWLGIAHFYAPAPAGFSAQDTKIWFAETYKWQTIVGCTLLYIGSALLTPGSIQWGIMLAKIEGQRPVWSITTAVCGIFISLIVFLNACAWIVCSYRATTSPDVIQAFYDWAWFAFLFGWIYLAIEMVASAMVELKDKSDQPIVPRWMAWATLLSAMTMLGAIGPAFFKVGPFAYDGLIAFYVPVGVWGSYLVLTNWFMYQKLNREQEEQRNTPGRSEQEIEQGYRLHGAREAKAGRFVTK